MGFGPLALTASFLSVDTGTCEDAISAPKSERAERNENEFCVCPQPPVLMHSWSLGPLESGAT